MRPRGPESRIRKASYYVWFLGAGECRGLRGIECVRPVVANLIARERVSPPDKVTLQISGRGVRVVCAGDGTAAPTKHFIPAAAITYVQQEDKPNDDLVSCILLLYNHATRCPVHLHAYRCDTTQTAVLLRQHLQHLAGRPDHQAKLAALEARLQARGLPLPHTPTTRGSDGASTGSSGSSSMGQGTTLYDSLAAELREKLGSRGAPLLLPPKDYDPPVPSRSERKTTTTTTTPTTPPTSPPEDDQATRSSGIGSDHHSTPSPTHEADDDDDDWLGYDPHPPNTTTITTYMAPHHPHNTTTISPPRGRPRQLESPVRGAPPPQRHLSPVRMCGPPRDLSPVRMVPGPPRDLSPVRMVTGPSRDPRDVSPVRMIQPRRHRGAAPHHHHHHHHPRDRSVSPGGCPRERFQDAREKFRSLERWGAPPPTTTTPTTSTTPTTTPPPWEGITPPHRYHHHHHHRPSSPSRGRSPTREWRGTRSPDRGDHHHQYQRARSMHDLSARRGGAAPHNHHHDSHDPHDPHDPRRRSLYEATEDSVGGRGPRRYRSHASLGGRRASSPSHSSCTSSSSSSVGSYAPLPDTRRPPGLDRATARPDPLDTSPRHHHHHHHHAPHHAPRRTYDYPVNGGTAPLHMARAPPPLLLDDPPPPPHRRARQPPPQFVRAGGARY